jgi:hypothetical protein
LLSIFFTYIRTYISDFDLLTVTLCYCLVLTEIGTESQPFSEASAQLLQSVSGGLNDLVRIAEEALGILRGEAQVSCFYFLHRMAYLKTLSGLEGVASSGAVAGGSKGDKRGFAGAASSSGSTSSSAAAAAASSGYQEVEALVSNFSQHIRNIEDAVLCAATSDALALVLSPVCAVAPRVLLRSVRHLMISQSSSLSSRRGAGGDIGNKTSSDRSRLLRGVVACQQRYDWTGTLAEITVLFCILMSCLR